MGRDLRQSIDMSFRLFSDNVPLDAIVRRLSLPLSHLHIKGQPIANAGPLAARPAKRHYASVAGAQATTVVEVIDWFRRQEHVLAADAELICNLANGEVEGVFWIAQFGDEPAPTLKFGPDVRASIAALHASMFIENYTRGAEDPASTTWIPERDSLGASMRGSQS